MLKVFVSDPRIFLEPEQAPIDISGLKEYISSLEAELNRAEQLKSAFLETPSDDSVQAPETTIRNLRKIGREVAGACARFTRQIRKTKSYIQRAENCNRHLTDAADGSVRTIYARWKDWIRKQGRDTELSGNLEILLVTDTRDYDVEQIRAMDPDIAQVYSLDETDALATRLAADEDQTLHVLVAPGPFYSAAWFIEDTRLPRLEEQYAYIRELYRMGVREFRFFSDEVAIRTEPAARRNEEASPLHKPSDEEYVPVGFPVVMDKARHRLKVDRLLDDFVGIHKGRRAFVLGNGPSLARTDMSLLKDEVTFGANRVYLGFEKWGFATTYWTVTDRLQIEKYHGEFVENMEQYDSMKFIPLCYHELFPCVESVCLMNHNFVIGADGPEFSMDPFVTNTGKSVMFVNLQLAAMMGCSPIIILGMDHRYGVPSARQQSEVGKFTAKRFLSTTGNSQYGAIPVWSVDEAYFPTHFDERYTQDKIFHAPDLAKISESMHIAFSAAGKSGIEILNATPDSALDSVPRIKFRELTF